jgi:hypothetical protein
MRNKPFLWKFSTVRITYTTPHLKVVPSGLEPWIDWHKIKKKHSKQKKRILNVQYEAYIVWTKKS